MQERVAASKTGADQTVPGGGLVREKGAMLPVLRGAGKRLLAAVTIQCALCWGICEQVFLCGALEGLNPGVFGNKSCTPCKRFPSLFKPDLIYNADVL